jgi:CRP/FNR family transcriptional regulator
MRDLCMRDVPAATGISQSFLADVRPSAVEAIRRLAVVYRHRSGDTVVSESEHWTGIVLRGMARVFLTTKGGRQVTLRHARPGSSIGVGALLGESTVSAQAVTDCEVLSLDTDQVKRLARDDASLAFAIARETSLRLRETYREVVIREQGSVRQRLARQLLHFAGQIDPDDPLGLPLSHEEIADAIGSAREVVSRHLARFQADEMLALERGRIRIVDPVKLDSAARETD